MSPLFKRFLVLLPLLALLAVPSQGFGQSGRDWSERFDVVPASKTNNGKIGRWLAFMPLETWILNDWRAKAAKTASWHTNTECQDAMKYTREALAANNIQAGLGTSNMLGEYFGDVDTLVVHGGEAETADGFGTLIHESWHRGTGDDDDDIRALNVRLGTKYDGLTLESCHDEAREEEDDEDDPNGGGDPVEPVCEEKLVAVYYTVYEREYRTGGTCLSSDDADGSDWCSGVGTWVKVRKTKVKWETQTVCSS